MTVTQTMIITFVTLAAFILIFMLFSFGLPLFDKLEFNNTCDQYFSMMVTNGSLSAAEKNQLISTLTDNDKITNVKVITSEAPEWGGEVGITITCDLKITNYLYDRTFQMSFSKTSLSNQMR